MIGHLPTTLIVDGREYEINSDFRFALSCLQAFEDHELTDSEKRMVLLRNIYVEIPKNEQDAAEQAVWFLDCGKEVHETQKILVLMDWAQDEQYIFSAINKKAGFSVRQLEYLHWWDFVGYYMEPDESLFAQIVNIRAKRKKGRKLEKWEQEFYIQNRHAIDLQREADEAERLRREIEGE